MFNEAERNYDIHDQELLAVFRGLTHWRHLLLSSPFPTTVLTNHKNLEYYKEPHHINRRIARYVQQLADYNFIIKHIPGEQNKADALRGRTKPHILLFLVPPPSLVVVLVYSSFTNLCGITPGFLATPLALITVLTNNNHHIAAQHE